MLEGFFGFVLIIVLLKLGGILELGGYVYLEFIYFIFDYNLSFWDYIV